MATHDVSNCDVYYSTTGAADSFLPLPEAISYGFDSDTEGRAVVRTFNARHVRAGDDVDTYDISALLDWTAQAAFRAAKRNGTTIHLALLADETAEEGQLQTVKILTYRFEADAEGDFARFRFTAEGDGALTEITALP